MSKSIQVSPIKKQSLLSEFTPSVSVENGKAVTTSRAIAEYFQKQHYHVTQKIEALDCSDHFLTHNFSRVKFEHKGNSYIEYQITKDGFVFLAMGFTGKRAAEFKEAYIHAFNDMEAELIKAKELPASDTTLEKLLLEIPEGRLVELPPTLIQAMEYRSMTMAVEAKEAIEEYLRRLISYTCVNGHGELDADKAFKRVGEAKLESALLHKKMYLLNAYKGFASMLKNYGDQLCTEVNQYK